jgi:hypothetical protein
MESMKLKDPQILPGKLVLEEALTDSYPAFEELMEIVTSENFGLIADWNYYNDGKAWLLKVSFKKKTVFWLSVWDNYFKTAFYFTEKNCNGIFELDIDDEIKKNFKTQQPIGKLLPLVIEIKQKDQLFDLLKIIDYKRKLK